MYKLNNNFQKVAFVCTFTYTYLVQFPYKSSVNFLKIINLYLMFDCEFIQLMGSNCSKHSMYIIRTESSLRACCLVC